jgi:hypothetical protein
MTRHGPLSDDELEEIASFLDVWWPNVDQPDLQAVNRPQRSARRLGFA